MDMRPQSEKNRSVLYGVTVGTSASALLRGQLAWLQSRGWRVRLVSSPGKLAEQAADREGVELLTIPMQREISPVADVKALARWIRIIRKVRPSVVNVSTPKAGLVGGLAARACRVPKRIYVVRGLRLEGSTGWKRQILWAAEWVATRVATDVVFVSESLAKVAHEMRTAPAGRSWVIGAGSSNGVNADAVLSRASEVVASQIRHSLGFEPHEFIVGFIGRLAPDKGMSTLVRTLQSDDLSPDVRLLVVGPVEDPEILDALGGLGDRIRVVGWTDDVWGHLPAMDVLILPTRREGFPNVVLEAASVGIPCVTTRATGAVDSVVDDVTGRLVDVDDHEEIVRVLNELKRDPEQVRSYGRAARSRVLRDFEPERIWQGLLALMESRYDSPDLRSIEQIIE